MYSRCPRRSDVKRLDDDRIQNWFFGSNYVPRGFRLKEGSGVGGRERDICPTPANRSSLNHSYRFNVAYVGNY